VSFAEDLARVLGLNPWKVVSITLRVEADQDSTALVVMKPTPAEERGVKQALKRYVIVELPEDARGA